jgi:hypothetical protein
MRDTLKINFFNISEVSKTPLTINGKLGKKITYTEALELNLIEGNEDGWRLPTLKEWKFISLLEPLGIISFPEGEYLTSETYPDYIPEIVRDEDPEINDILSENPFSFDDSGISDVYIWDTRDNGEYDWAGYDGDPYYYILVRNIKN